MLVNGFTFHNQLDVPGHHCISKPVGLGRNATIVSQIFSRVIFILTTIINVMEYNVHGSKYQNDSKN